jgi:CelD/BcsL family acetyltransferase involved in cellulose biosynthesis
MSNKNHDLRVDLIDSDKDFIDIQNEWDELSEKSVSPSFYATYPFVYTAWRHYRNENDRLLILTVRRGATLVGIAPFRLENRKMGNIRFLKGVYVRVIRFISEWGGGDKPSLLTIEEPEIVWEAIFQYLIRDFTKWDMISLAEQPENSPVRNLRLLNNFRYYTKFLPESVSYYVSITGTWEDYLKNRGRNTRRYWKTRREKLLNLPEEVKFIYFEDPKTLPEALQKFISIEQSGWKKNRNFTIGGNAKNKEFYDDLLQRLAGKEMVAIHFLVSAPTEIAGAIVYKNQNTVYIAKITFREEYSAYSPGIILSSEIIKNLFGSHYTECDFLGFRGEEKNNLKNNWSTGTQQTITIQIYKKNLPMFLYMNGNKIKNIFWKFFTTRLPDGPSEKEQVIDH